MQKEESYKALYASGYETLQGAIILPIFVHIIVTIFTDTHTDKRGEKSFKKKSAGLNSRKYYYKLSLVKSNSVTLHCTAYLANSMSVESRYSSSLITKLTIGHDPNQLRPSYILVTYHLRFILILSPNFLVS
jgi:hypothetical protein